jgi:hypothetical protein
MVLKNLFLIVIAIIIMVNPGFAQYDDDDGGSEDLVSYLSLGWSWGGWEGARPFIEAGYGLNYLTHQDMTRDFYVGGMLEGKIGYSLIDSFSRGIVSLHDQYIVGSYSEQDYNTVITQDETNLINEKLTRFGFGVRHGYGYNLAILKIIPYTQHSMQWYKMQSVRPYDISSPDSALLDRFEDSYRFGLSNEAALKIRLFRSIDATASYEYSVIYPRVVFFQWFVSYTVLYIGEGIVSKFARDIVHNSPLLGPILYFALTNGVTWAYTYALKNDMNWPFKSEAPMINNVAKLSISISF